MGSGKSPHHEEQASRLTRYWQDLGASSPSPGAAGSSGSAAYNKSANRLAARGNGYQRLAMTAFLRTISINNLGLILDSTRFTKPKVHAEVR